MIGKLRPEGPFLLLRVSEARTFLISNPDQRSEKFKFVSMRGQILNSLNNKTVHASYMSSVTWKITSSLWLIVVKGLWASLEEILRHALWSQVRTIPIFDPTKANLWFCSMVSFNQRRRTSSWHDSKICSPPMFQWLLKRLKCYPNVRKTGLDQFGRLQTYYPTLHDVPYYPRPSRHRLARLYDETNQTN